MSKDSSDSTKTEVDIFMRDWNIARSWWIRKHRVFDYNYLNYKSILTYNNVYGKDYLNAFGMQVFVPRTYQAVEGLKAQLNSRKTEFVVKAGSGVKGFRDKERSKYFQTMDNVEWRRSKAEHQKQLATHNALVYGIGYLSNFFVDDHGDKHLPTLPEEDDKKPASAVDGTPSEETVDVNDPKSLEWKTIDMTSYRGMKPESENPYYVFPDPYAKNDKRAYCYKYVVGTVDEIRAYVVARKWMTEAEASTKVVACAVERFDGIKDTIDAFFDQPVSKWTRGDSVTNVSSNPSATELVKGEFSAIIERYEDDYFEARLVSADTETLYKDWNIYPHKQIPIIALKDNPQPDEACGMGEPEIVRWQQVEENKLHNLLMQAVMMSVVQRYAVNSNLLEDETDILTYNPFKPIRLKPLPGITVSQAIMPLPQPEVKQSPFQLLEQVKQIGQATTGASDFVVSGNNSIADSATESNNLVAATTMRIKEKARYIEEVALVRLVEQWHACFFYFYDEEMDFELTGEDSFIRWIPYDRAEANENIQMVEKAREDLNAMGGTLEEVYQNAGYHQVVFMSDVQEGSFYAEVKVSDMELDRQKTFDDGLKVMKVMNETNIAAKEIGDTRRFDIFKMAEEIMRGMPSIRDPKEFIIGDDKTGRAAALAAMVPQPAAPGVPGAEAAPGPSRKPGRPGNDSLMGLRPGQTTTAASSGDVGAEVRATGDVGNAQATNLGM